MDHRQITLLRDRAKVARDYREKVVITPDQLDQLLDYAFARIEEDQ